MIYMYLFVTLFWKAVSFILRIDGVSGDADAVFNGLDALVCGFTASISISFLLWNKEQIFWCREIEQHGSCVQPLVELEAEDEPKAEAQAKPELETETQAQAEPEPEPVAELEVVDLETEVELELDPEQEPELQAECEPQNWTQL